MDDKNSIIDTKNQEKIQDRPWFEGSDYTIVLFADDATKKITAGQIAPTQQQIFF